MAGTVVQGNISTEEGGPPEEKKIDMVEKFQMLDPDQSQFTTLSDKLGTGTQAIQTKVNWFEEEMFPNIVSSTAAQLVGDVALTLTAGQGKLVQANDHLRNMRTGEMIRIVSVATDTLSIARNVGNIAAAAVNVGDVWLVTGDAQPQGSDFPTPRYLARVLGFNYTQITRTTWGFTGTATAIELFGGREPAREAKRKALEHKRKWENIGFFGARSYSAAVPPENEPRGTAGGAIEFITTYKRDANGPLTPDFFDLFLSDVFGNGTDEKILFASPTVIASMSKWNRTGMGTQFEAPEGGKVHGVKIDAFISGAYGYRVPVVVKKEWSKYPTANKGYGGYAFLLDMSYIERRPMRDRDTKLLTDQQPKGKDTYNAEYMTEATYQFACERAHGILFGVT